MRGEERAFAALSVSYTHLDVYKRQYLFRLYALLPAGLPAGRLRSNLSVWQAQRGSCSFGRLRGYVSGPTLGFDEGGKEFALGALHGLRGGQVGL